MHRGCQRDEFQPVFSKNDMKKRERKRKDILKISQKDIYIFPPLI